MDGELSGTNLPHRTCNLVLDTSALLLVSEGVDPVQEAVEVLEGYCSDVRVVLLSPVIQELHRLASGRGRKAAVARLALGELNKHGGRVQKVDFSGCSAADDCILKYSQGVQNAEVVVLTTDKRLARTLKETGIRYITWWRSRRRFVLG